MKPVCASKGELTYIMLIVLIMWSVKQSGNVIIDLRILSTLITQHMKRK